MKHVKTILIVLLVLGVGWGIYSLIVANQEIVADEASPLASAPATTTPEPSASTGGSVAPSGSVMVDDMLGKMDDATAKQFMVQTEAMKSTIMVKDDPMPTPTPPAPTPTASPMPPAGGAPAPAGPMLIARGSFQARAHDVEGRALLIEDQGTKTVRFEDFETINGPNLHIWLSADLGGKDYVDLGSIKATKGNVNYAVPEGTDTRRYNKVLVWCVPFRVLFSYAELQS